MESNKLNKIIFLNKIIEELGGNEKFDNLYKKWDKNNKIEINPIDYQRNITFVNTHWETIKEFYKLDCLNGLNNCWDIVKHFDDDDRFAEAVIRLLFQESVKECFKFYKNYLNSINEHNLMHQEYLGFIELEKSRPWLTKELEPLKNSILGKIILSKLSFQKPKLND